MGPAGSHVDRRWCFGCFSLWCTTTHQGREGTWRTSKELLRHSKKEFIWWIFTVSFFQQKTSSFWCRGVCGRITWVIFKKTWLFFLFLAGWFFLKGILPKTRDPKNWSPWNPGCFLLILDLRLFGAWKKSKNIIPSDWWWNGDLPWWKGKNTPQTSSK